VILLSLTFGTGKAGTCQRKRDESQTVVKTPNTKRDQRRGKLLHDTRACRPLSRDFSQSREPPRAFPPMI
jgi:hypothetical protein